MTAGKVKAKRKPAKRISAPLGKQEETPGVSFVLNPEVAEPIYVTHV